MKLAIVREMRRLLADGSKWGKHELATFKDPENDYGIYLEAEENQLANFCLLGACAYAVAKLEGFDKLQEITRKEGAYAITVTHPTARAVVRELVSCIPINDKTPETLQDYLSRDMDNLKKHQYLYDPIVYFNDRVAETFEDIDILLECAEKRLREQEESSNVG
jgi:hypothetical protein